MKAVWLLLACSLLALPAAAQVQKWSDEQGGTHYGDRPPIGTETKTSALRGTVSLSDGMTVVPEFFKSHPAQGKPDLPSPGSGQVWIYTTPSCGYCRRAKEHMRLKGIPYVEKDIQANPANYQEFRALGGRGVPLTLAGGDRHGGYNEKRFEAFLKGAGF